MEEPVYEVDPEDPRAPPEDVWAALSEAARRRVLAQLPSEIPRALPSEGDAHFNPKVRARESLGAAARAEQEAARAEQEAARASAAEARLARLEARMRELGLDPDE